MKFLKFIWEGIKSKAKETSPTAWLFAAILVIVNLVLLLSYADVKPIKMMHQYWPVMFVFYKISIWVAIGSAVVYLLIGEGGVFNIGKVWISDTIIVWLLYIALIASACMSGGIGSTYNVDKETPNIIPKLK